MKKKYIDDLQRFRKYYIDIFTNFCNDIELTKIEEQVLFYIEEDLSSTSLLKKYLNYDMSKNDYPRLEMEYFENEELYDLIGRLLKERKKVEKI